MVINNNCMTKVIVESIYLCNEWMLWKKMRELQLSSRFTSAFARATVYWWWCSSFFFFDIDATTIQKKESKKCQFLSTDKESNSISLYGLSKGLWYHFSTYFLLRYPSDADKHLLARQTGLSRNQVCPLYSKSSFFFLLNIFLTSSRYS